MPPVYSEKKCEVCGTPFIPTSPNQKYCPDHFWRRLNGGFPKRQECAFCGKIFESEQNKRYCSKRCGYAARKGTLKNGSPNATAAEILEEQARRAHQKHFDEVCRAADAAGMSYGRYVQMIEPPKGKNVPLIFIVKGSVKPSEIKS